MKQSPKLVGGAILAGIISLFASSVSAELPPKVESVRLPVVIVVPRCATAPLADLRRIASVELGIDVAVQLEDDAPPHDPIAEHQGSAEESNVTRVAIACSGQWLHLQVFDPVSGKTLSRHLDLSNNDVSTRTRMLALSIAELVAASWIELVAHPTPRPHIVEAKASANAREIAAGAAQKVMAQPSFYRVEAVASAQRTGSTDLLTLGGGIGTSWIKNGWQVVGGDLRVETGSAEVPLGTIRTLLASGSVSFRIRQKLGWMAVEGGLGARAGLAHMQGEPAEIEPRPQASTATFPWWGPMILVRAEAAIARRVAVLLGFEAGRVAYAADGQSAGQTGAAIENQWVSITAGPALSFEEGP
ncbi:MAG: hypothetical protein ABW133_12740 [Polyangiaceae bacterium]